MGDVKEVTLKDVFVQLNSMKRDLDTSFTAVNENMEHIKHIKLRNDIKLLRDELEDIKKSTNSVWDEIENIKGNMAAASADVVGMKSEIQILKDQLKVEKDRNVKLEQYTRRENIRLLNVAEGKMKIQRNSLSKFQWKWESKHMIQNFMQFIESVLQEIRGGSVLGINHPRRDISSLDF